MKKGRRQAGTPEEPEILFHPFDRIPPKGEICLDRIYDLFADRPIQWDWCLRCFGSEWEGRMRAHLDVRTAPHDSFDMIYFEHPRCSGGEATFLHWLPRGLEISFFDSRLYPTFHNQMARLGLLAWPQEWLMPLRRLFCRVCINWFAEGDPQPFKRIDFDGTRSMKDSEIGWELICALCALRVEPQSIAEWLLEIDTPTGWRTTLNLLQSEKILDNFVYYVLPDDAREADFQAAQEALDRRVRADFHRVFSNAVLTAKWERTFEHDPRLADAVSDAETMLDVYRPGQGIEERGADEEALRRAIGLHVMDV